MWWRQRRMAWEISLELRVESAEFSTGGESLTTEGTEITEEEGETTNGHESTLIPEFSTDKGGASGSDFFSVWRYGAAIAEFSTGVGCEFFSLWRYGRLSPE